jgi:hypothetical protein
MAVLGVTATRKGDWITFVWEAHDGGTDTHAPVYLNHNVSDIMFEADGTFNGSAITLNGFVTNSAATTALVDVDATAISLTAVGSATVRDAWPHFIPVSDQAGSTESIVCRLYAKVVR